MKHTFEKLVGGPSRRARLAVTAAGIGVVIAVAGIALAQSGPPPQGGAQSGAPVEAIAACEAKVVGDVCSMTLPQNSQTVEGLCQSTPDEKLACMPNDAPPPRQ